MATESTTVATNLVGRHATWLSDGRRESGTVVAITFWQGGFVLLIAMSDGLRQKTASGVTVD
jgi:hypothetical protein